MYMRLMHNGKSCNVAMNYRVLPDEWDAGQQCFILPDDKSYRKRQLSRYQTHLERTANQVNAIVRDLERKREYTVDDIRNSYRLAASEIKTLEKYVMYVVAELQHQGKERTARAYGTAVTRLKAFCGNRELKLEDINAELMNGFQKQLKKEGVSKNTLSFYMRALRAIYNRAVGEGLIPRQPKNPFDEVYTDVLTVPKPHTAKPVDPYSRDIGLALR